MTDHFLKVEKRWFPAIVKGEKPWTIRKDDRPFAAGDWLIKCEWDGKRFTGRAVALEVLAVFRKVPSVADGHAVLSLGRPEEVAPEYLDEDGRYAGYGRQD